MDEIRICIACKVDVLDYYDRDGDLSCECQVRRRDDDPPDSWIDVRLRTITDCGMCGSAINGNIYRCVDCDLPYHKECLDYHIKHGSALSDLRSKLAMREEDYHEAVKSYLSGTHIIADLRQEVERLKEERNLMIEGAHESGIKRAALRAALAEEIKISLARKQIADNLTAELSAKDYALCRARAFIKELIKEAWSGGKDLSTVRGRKTIFGILSRFENEKWPSDLLQEVRLYISEEENGGAEKAKTGNVEKVSGETLGGLQAEGTSEGHGENATKDPREGKGEGRVKERSGIPEDDKAKELSRMRNERDSARTPRGLRKALERDLALLQMPWDEASDIILTALSSTAPCPHEARNALLEKVAEAANNGPCRHDSSHKGLECPLCVALIALKEAL